MSSSEGKIAVVTGAGRGLGAAIAMSLARAGYKLILGGRNNDAIAGTATRIEAAMGKRPATFELDLSDASSVARAVEAILRDHHRVDLLVNNGTMWLEGRTAAYSPAEVLGVVNSAVSGTFLLTQGLLPLLNRSASPDIVTIGSTSGLPNAPIENVSVPFYAAKRAQAALADGLRQVLVGTPVRSIIIHPPNLDDISQEQPEWAYSERRPKGARATNRDVVEALLFAVTRPRNVTVSITIDTDESGILSER